MSNTNRIAFVYGRAALNGAKIQYMPFGLNVVKLLAEKNVQIDLYLTQSYTEEYQNILPENVNVIFIDNKRIWKFGSGTGLYFLLNIYFYFKSLSKPYNTVWGIGQVGAVLGGKLAKRKNVPFYYLSDEFPNVSYLKIWREQEKKYALTSKFYVVPDESRLEITQKQISGLNKLNGYVLPNIPLNKKESSKTKIDWYSKLHISNDSKIVMYAGGIDKENNIELLLSVFPFSDERFKLVIVGNGNAYKNNMFYSHQRIIWIETPLSDEELNSLIEQSLCNVCYYSNIMDLEFVGKSSGKIMRSLIMRKPVITTKFNSLQFIEDDGMGILITKPVELIDALFKIEANKELYFKNIDNNIPKYYFENYWNQLPL